MKKLREKHIRGLLCLLLTILTVLADIPMPGAVFGGEGTVSEVKAEETQNQESVTIRFMDPSGEKEYTDLQMQVNMGDTVRLPVKKGYRWRLTGSFRFIGGSNLTLSSDASWARFIKNGVLTLKAEKFYYVQFYNTNGTSTSKMKALKMTVAAGKKVRLPSVPSAFGYASLGWSTKKNASTAKYSAGKVITVKRNLKFYAVRKKIATSKVVFCNNAGVSTLSVYKKLNQRVETGTSIKLPELPKFTGYQSVGWATTKGSTTAQYQAGDSVKITANTRFYAVYKKAVMYTVTFYLNNGRSTSAYRKLQVSTESGSSITLPSVPQRDGYVGLGWTTTKGTSKSVQKVGSKYKVTQNISFYAVQEAGVTISLCKNDGTLYRKISVGKGDYLSLPAVANTTGYTFLGWSRTKGRTVNPEYEAGGRIRVNGNVTLYAVVFDRNTEPDLTQTDMTQVDLWKRKYKQIIFVGDSRTERMQTTLNKAFGSSSTVTWNVEFVAKSGMGLDWLKGEGTTSLLNVVNKNYSTQSPTAVIFNLGVNDLSNASSYVTYMKTLATTLKKKNCKLFYMSVNPGNSKTMENAGHQARSEASVRQFNNTIRAQLAGTYTFIDTYTWLMQTGYSTNASKSGTDNKVDDGLHYTTKTYKRIFYHCLEYLLLEDIPS